MFAEQTVTAMPLLRLHSEFTDALPKARTPLEVLTALAAEGAQHGLELWCMALRREAGEGIYLCSQSPLEHGVAALQLSHFITSANEMAERSRLPLWTGTATQVVCLQPQLPPLDPELAEYHDMPIDTGASSPLLVRAASLRNDGGSEPNWSKLEVMLRYATPYLRALETNSRDTAYGMLDLDSGAYSWQFFLDALEREVARARRQQAELALAVLELRPLPQTGEIPPQVHRLIGAHMARIVRRTDLVGRIGAASYAAFLHNTGPRPALIAAGRIADALREDSEISASASFSLGVSGWEGEGLLEVTALLAQAEEAASEAAQGGAGRTFVYV
jgi:GGDEF domain-containing protein